MSWQLLDSFVPDIRIELLSSKFGFQNGAYSRRRLVSPLGNLPYTLV